MKLQGSNTFRHLCYLILSGSKTPPELFEFLQAVLQPEVAARNCSLPWKQLAQGPETINIYNVWRVPGPLSSFRLCESFKESNGFILQVRVAFFLNNIHSKTSFQRGGDFLQEKCYNSYLVRAAFLLCLLACDSKWLEALCRLVVSPSVHTSGTNIHFGECSLRGLNTNLKVKCQGHCDLTKPSVAFWTGYFNNTLKESFQIWLKCSFGFKD